MRKSRQFWQDVDVAIWTLILRQLLHQIIVEGRNIRQPSIGKKQKYSDRMFFGKFRIYL
jgi:hypothetical protein